VKSLSDLTIEIFLIFR